MHIDVSSKGRLAQHYLHITEQVPNRITPPYSNQEHLLLSWKTSITVRPSPAPTIQMAKQNTDLDAPTPKQATRGYKGLQGKKGLSQDV
eukprot:1154994-Pelagomonas_calceolata.AAC.1